MITLTIPGRPYAWQRARYGRQGKVYTPSKQRRFLETTALYLKAKAREQGVTKLEGPVMIDAIFDFDKEQTHLVIGEVDREELRTARSDIDNILKSWLEVLQYSGLVDDDSQVAIVHAEKVGETRDRAKSRRNRKQL